MSYVILNYKPILSIQKMPTDVDLVFKRGDVEYMKFEGTLQAVELTTGAKSNTYDSIGNADVSFRRNTIDFMYLRNGNVEVNTGISLLAESAKFDAIDSATPTNVVFERGGVNFFTLDGTKNIIGVSTGRALSSQYIYGDYFSIETLVPIWFFKVVIQQMMV